MLKVTRFSTVTVEAAGKLCKAAQSHLAIGSSIHRCSRTFCKTLQNYAKRILSIDQRLKKTVARPLSSGDKDDRCRVLRSRINQYLRLGGAVAGARLLPGIRNKRNN